MGGGERTLKGFNLASTGIEAAAIAQTSRNVGSYPCRLSPRISFWIILSIGSGFLAYYQLPEWFPHLFRHAK
jgi:hypothetical protein